jgi:hypothetical protein
MKLSKETLTVIKNYASINNNLLIKTGNKLSTVSVGKTIFSRTLIAEEFPVQFPIYDVNEFLSALSLFEDPDIEFTEKWMTIKQGNNSLKYFASVVTNLVVPPEKDIDIQGNINFSLESATLAMILRTAPILKSADVSIIGDGSTLSILVADKKNATSNSYSYSIGTTAQTFKVNIKIENLKFLPGDYDVTVSSSAAKFKSKTTELVYFVAIEADSTIE